MRLSARELKAPQQCITSAGRRKNVLAGSFTSPKKKRPLTSRYIVQKLCLYKLTSALSCPPSLKAHQQPHLGVERQKILLPPLSVQKSHPNDVMPRVGVWEKKACEKTHSSCPCVQKEDQKPNMPGLQTDREFRDECVFGVWNCKRK